MKFVGGRIWRNSLAGWNETVSSHWYRGVRADPPTTGSPCCGARRNAHRVLAEFAMDAGSHARIARRALPRAVPRTIIVLSQFLSFPQFLSYTRRQRIRQLLGSELREKPLDDITADPVSEQTERLDVPGQDRCRALASHLESFVSRESYVSDCARRTMLDAVNDSLMRARRIVPGPNDLSLETALSTIPAPLLGSDFV